MHFRPTHSYTSTIHSAINDRHTVYHICEPYETLTNFDYITTKHSGSNKIFTTYIYYLLLHLLLIHIGLVC